ncbi:UNVERIFIED_CONTAM: hypothetical protein Sradi_4214700 [Sesamum radiatum]|uniref:Uncharacterized protein n=1 Tax=Sesamum radiatum TaxID=300843 RepID=A0AAW2P3C7_SESRA
MIRAEEVQLSLGNDHPTFLKALVRSHVASCFWMVRLGGCYYALKFYLDQSCWVHFHLPFKNHLSAGSACALLQEGTVDAQSKKRRPKSLPLTVVQKKKEKEEPLVPQLGQPEEQSGNDSDEVASEVLEGTKFSGSSFHFKDVKSFEEFHIVVNGVCIDSELPEHIRQKYYDLCCSKNAFLHDRVLPGLYSKLAAGMIVETINIADVIRGCKLNTPRKDFEVWEKSLRSFELLGLNVGFLRARLRRLLSLAFDTEGALEVRRYWETQKERSRTEEEIQKLEAQLVELKELSAKYDHEIENLKTKAESYELKFQEEVDAPW